MKYWSLPEEESVLRKDKLIYMVGAIDRLIKKNRQKIEIVDLGCGAGYYSLPLLKLGYNLTCVDLSKKNLNIFREKLKKAREKKLKVEIINSSIEKYSPSKKFDVVLCSEVLEHVNNSEEIIKKIYSLLKDDGVFILCIPNGFGTYEVFFDWPLILLRKLFNIKNDPGRYHRNFFTLRRIKEILSDNGFKLLSFKKAIFFPIIPIKSKILELIDIKLAALVPPALVNDYMLVSKKYNHV